MIAPTLQVELLAQTTGPAFGFTALVLDDAGDGQLDEEGLAGLDEWVDVTDEVRAVSINRGQRTRSFDAFRAGNCRIVFDNRLRQFDPSNDGADLAGNLVPGRQMRVTATPGGVGLTWDEVAALFPSWAAATGESWDDVSLEDRDAERLFVGTVESWSVQWRGNADSTSTVTLVDGLATLAAARLAETSAVGAGELTSERVTRVLDLSEVDWSATARNIGAGQFTVGGYTGGGNAASYLQDVAASEGGALFASRTGDLTFVGRLDAPSSPAATLTDDRSDVLCAHYVDAELTSDSSVLFNRIVVEGDDHATVTSEDTGSQTAFGVRALERTSLLDNEDDAQTLADSLKVRFSEPELRFGTVSLLLGDHSPSRQADLLELDLFDVVTVERNPPGGGTPEVISQVARVDTIRLDLSPGSPWRMQLTLSSGDKQLFFVLDSAEFGELDDDKLA